MIGVTMRKIRNFILLTMICISVAALPVSAAQPVRTASQRTAANAKKVTPIEKAISGAAPATQAEAAAREIAKSEVLQSVFAGIKPGQNLYTVGEGQPFATISQAVEAAKDKDVILVFPGYYVEAVDVRSKNISIIGLCREECFLNYPDDDYDTPPLQMSRGSLQNMTVMVRDHKTAGDAAKAYCLHIDDDRSRNSSLTITNCRFLSESYQAVGIGLRGNFFLTFNNCEFYSGDNYAAVFCHDWEACDKKGKILPGEDRQRLIMLNCILENEGPAPTLQLHSQEIPGNKAECLLAMNVIVNRRAPGNLFDLHAIRPVLTGEGFMGTSTWVLNVNSFGNSSPFLNVKAMP